MDDRLSRLSEREKEVLTLLAQAKSNAEIARELYVVPGTVAAHIRSIFRKLNLTNRTQALYFAHKNSLPGEILKK